MAGDGRFAASLVLLVALTLGLYGDTRDDGGRSTDTPLFQVLNIAAKPFTAGRRFLFDGYQRIFPRMRTSQPVTVVGIDEASLKAIGQWPWPRDRVAQLVEAIGRHRPAAIGMDIYWPEIDRTSPSKVAEGLTRDHGELAQQLKQLPSHDARLAQAIKISPTVIAAVGFGFSAPSTSESIRSVPLRVEGGDAVPHVPAYTAVLASLPELQAAASGQGLVSIDGSDDNIIRRVPLAMAINGSLAPSLSMEMLRVGTGSSAIGIEVDGQGVKAMSVADLRVPVQRNGAMWLHFARFDSSNSRNVSAVNVLEGRVKSEAFESKLVLVGLVGSGLVDRRMTALGEIVPGVELQAQVLESMFDGRFITRSRWMALVEAALLLVFGALLIWVVPRSASTPSPVLKIAPKAPAIGVVVLACGFFITGLVLFYTKGWLFDAVFPSLGLVAVLGSLMYSVMMLVYRQTRQMEIALIASLRRSEQELEQKVQQRTIELRTEQARTKELLHNILPVEVAEELSLTGRARPARHEFVTVLFTDFKGFTQAVSTTSADRIVTELNEVFAAFDDIADDCGVEKIKTIGDAYMAAAGLPKPCEDHAQRCVRAGLRMVEFLEHRNKTAEFVWLIRVGVHSGPVVAGVVGKRKYAFDIWGDTVNVAARMESAGQAGRVNISATTYDLISTDFDCEHRGKLEAKGKGQIDMYFVNTRRNMVA